MVDSKGNDKFDLGVKGLNYRSMVVSEQLYTYPSLNSITVKWWQAGVAVGLGER